MPDIGYNLKHGQREGIETPAFDDVVDDFPQNK